MQQLNIERKQIQLFCKNFAHHKKNYSKQMQNTV